MAETCSYARNSSHLLSRFFSGAIPGVECSGNFSGCRFVIYRQLGNAGHKKDEVGASVVVATMDFVHAGGPSRHAFPDLCEAPYQVIDCRITLRFRSLEHFKVDQTMRSLSSNAKLRELPAEDLVKLEIGQTPVGLDRCQDARFRDSEEGTHGSRKGAPA